MHWADLYRRWGWLKFRAAGKLRRFLAPPRVPVRDREGEEIAKAKALIHRLELLARSGSSDAVAMLDAIITDRVGKARREMASAAKMRLRTPMVQNEWDRQ